MNELLRGLQMFYSLGGEDPTDDEETDGIYYEDSEVIIL